MITEKQTGLMPSWPRGHGIAEAFGHVAQITILVQIGGFIIGHIFPDLDPSEPRLHDLMLGFVAAAIFGSVSLGIRNNRLWLALLGIGVTGTTLVAVILMTMVRNMQTDSNVGGFEGLVLYGFGSVVVFLCWAAFREVRAETARRKGAHA